ncbi:hybrid sensor histidine kinase/response regulator, partial [Pseudomonas syringae pv. actinidiae]|nr:hybrid sensor histidine kinase/response regulator [Pseudomonas syringae pv. actinidiae]
MLDPLLANAMQQLELSSAAAAALTGQTTDSLAAGSPPSPVLAPAEPAAEPEPPFTPLRERRVAEGGERVLRVTASASTGWLTMSSKL